MSTFTTNDKTNIYYKDWTGERGSPSSSVTDGHSVPTPGKIRCCSAPRAGTVASRTTAAATAAPASHGVATTWTPTLTISRHWWKLSI